MATHCRVAEAACSSSPTGWQLSGRHQLVASAVAVAHLFVQSRGLPAPIGCPPHGGGAECGSIVALVAADVGDGGVGDCECGFGRFGSGGGDDDDLGG